MSYLCELSFPVIVGSSDGLMFINYQLNMSFFFSIVYLPYELLKIISLK